MRTATLSLQAGHLDLDAVCANGVNEVCAALWHRQPHPLSSCLLILEGSQHVLYFHVSEGRFLLSAFFTRAKGFPIQRQMEHDLLKAYSETWLKRKTSKFQRKMTLGTRLTRKDV
jgi:hypothetical protein